MKFISKYKSHILVFIVSGILFSSVGAYAALVISSNEVSVNSIYTDKTNVKDSLDEIYSEVDTGKGNIINSLNSKGLELSSNSTYANIVNGINSLPIGKTASGEWGYSDSDSNSILPFNSKMSPDLIKEFQGYIDVLLGRQFAYSNTVGDQILWTTDYSRYVTRTSATPALLGTNLNNGYVSACIVSTTSEGVLSNTGNWPITSVSTATTPKGNTVYFGVSGGGSGNPYKFKINGDTKGASSTYTLSDGGKLNARALALADFLLF